jgi:hypothetical protein
MTLMTDDDGTVYAVKTEEPTHNGVDVFTILMKDEYGGWGMVLGGFGARRPGGVVDLESLTTHAVREERQEFVRRIARRYLGYGLA